MWSQIATTKSYFCSFSHSVSDLDFMLCESLQSFLVAPWIKDNSERTAFHCRKAQTFWISQCVISNFQYHAKQELILG